MWHSLRLFGTVAGRHGRRRSTEAVVSKSRLDQLGQDVADNLTFDVREPVVATLELEGELFVIDAKLMQERRVKVVHADRASRDVVTEIVGRAVADSGLYP